MSVESQKACQPGDVLRVVVYGGVHHEGIVTETGSVISNSLRNGCVTEESVRSFAGLNRIENRGQLSDTSPYAAIAHARSQIGLPYNAYKSNCQHFVRQCYRLKPESHQKRWVVAGLGILAFLAII